LPYAAAALLARLLGLDFVDTLYLMRFAGFMAFTALIAVAIAITPFLGWALLAIAMLPAAIYARSVVSADGGTLAAAFVVITLALRSVAGLARHSRVTEAIALAACLLTKPPQISFALLPLMRRPLRDSLKHWRSIALVSLPGVVLLLAWLMASGGDTGNWRYIETNGLGRDQYDPAWKLGFLLEHPMHFISATLQSLDASAEIGKQLIGVLGWLDTTLLDWTYPLLGIALLAALFAPMPLDPPTRRRVAALALLSFAGYVLAVFLICYLAWTPIDADRVHGLQGRYFHPALPLLAMAFSAIAKRGLPFGLSVYAALFAAALGGVATLEAILRVDWKL
jgi:uncharacterized membrane protein